MLLLTGLPIILKIQSCYLKRCHIWQRWCTPDCLISICRTVLQNTIVITISNQVPVFTEPEQLSSSYVLIKFLIFILWFKLNQQICVQNLNVIIKIWKLAKSSMLWIGVNRYTYLRGFRYYIWISIHIIRNLLDLKLTCSICYIPRMYLTILYLKKTTSYNNLPLPLNRLVINTTSTQ